MPWSVIAAGALLLVAIIVIAFVFLYWRDAEPTPATYQTALSAFLRQGVSPLIAPDLAASFTSGNSTMRELKEQFPGFEDDIDAVDKALRDAEHDVLATVNGEAITRADLEAQLALLPADYRDTLDENQVLEEMINELLIIQYARSNGLEASGEEVDAAYDALLVKGNLTEEELEENIASYGLSDEDLRTLLEKKLTVDKVFASEIEPNVSVSLGEVKAFYDENEQVFVTEDGETVPFEQVAPLIEERLAAAERVAAYRTFIEALRSEATVVNNLEAAGEIAETPENASATPGPDVVVAENDTVIILPEENSTVVLPPEDEEPVAEEPETAAPPAVTGTVAETDLVAFASCLREEGATLFIASWDLTSNKEVEKFGDGRLDIVDCARSANAQACAEIDAYPTWRIAGEDVLGSLTLEELSARTGCPLD